MLVNITPEIWRRIIELAEDFINEMGDCDHDVGICVCGIKNDILIAKHELNPYEKTDKDRLIEGGYIKND